MIPEAARSREDVPIPVLPRMNSAVRVERNSRSGYELFRSR